MLRAEKGEIKLFHEFGNLPSVLEFKIGAINRYEDILRARTSEKRGVKIYSFRMSLLKKN